jgi:hypothetical protein
MRAFLVAFSGLAVLLVANGSGCGSSKSGSSTAPDGSTDDGTASSSGGVSGGSSGGGSSGGGSGGSGGGSSGGSSGGSVDAGVDVGDSVLMHHRNLDRDGLYVQPTFTKTAIAGLAQDTGFSASLPDPNDAVYAQPLFYDAQGSGTDLVIVATEGNNIYALNATTGATVWVKKLGTPVPPGSMECGNIGPVYGITGTPVIDYASKTLYADALVMGSKPQHEIFAVSLATGDVVSGWPIVVNTVAKIGTTQTFQDTATGERGGLTIVNGMLYVPFGGLFGDCATYYGWVVGVDLTNPTKVVPWATTYSGGGIWAPAGISSDGTSLFVATGNTFPPNSNSPWGGGDGVVSFGTGSAFGAMTGYYAPTEWYQLDQGDLDMGPTPIPFDMPGSTPSTLAVTFGKDTDAYLLDRTKLGGVGSALSATQGNSYTLQPSNSQIISAPVLYTTATATYVVVKAQGTMCTNSTNGSMTALTVVAGSPPSLAPSWCAGNGAGSPIVTTTDGHSNAIVWDIGASGDNHLDAYDGDTGAAISFPGNSVSIPNMRNYNTPIAAKGRIYVPADGTIVAFSL